MKQFKIALLLIPLMLSVVSCSSGNDDEATRKTTYYENVSDYWDTFPINWKSDVCEVISGPDDKEGLEKAIKVMKLMLRVNLSVDGIEISKDDDGYAKALRLFLSEKCIG